MAIQFTLHNYKLYQFILMVDGIIIYFIIILFVQSFDLIFFFFLRDFRFGTTGVLGGTIIDNFVGELVSSSKLNLSIISSHKLDELSSL